MLKLHDHGPVRELNLDRPPVNALNPQLVTELDEAIREAAGSSRAIVISGRAGLFSAGLDVPELMQLDREGMSAFWRQFFGLLETIARSPIPVAAAITGHSPAGGAVMGLFCDYRVMSRGEFVIGLNETRVGLLVPGVIRRALSRLTGTHRAERLIVSGTLLAPEAALDANLVDALSEDPLSTVQDAIEWCRQQLALPAHAMLGNRALMRHDIYRQFDELGEKDVAEFVNGWFNEETQRTLRALLEQLKNKA
jgi:enoyl-CoA hydratase/carnithine racemase